MNSYKLNRLSNIFDNAGQVVFAVVVLSPFVADFDKIDRFVVLSGVIVVMVCWIVSVWLTRKD
ncbi:MAG: hypothetical protein CEO21_433 [Microgenomates group bacterium Gr01-1014_80]|nr:MAG: hypothetical protein CEO21_433 [Microgenomates group bacterium Gr01-1014_80]